MTFVPNVEGSRGRVRGTRNARYYSHSAWYPLHSRSLSATLLRLLWVDWGVLDDTRVDGNPKHPGGEVSRAGNGRIGQGLGVTAGREPTSEAEHLIGVSGAGGSTS